MSWKPAPPPKPKPPPEVPKREHLYFIPAIFPGSSSFRYGRAQVNSDSGIYKSNLPEHVYRMLIETPGCEELVKRSDRLVGLNLLLFILGFMPIIVLIGAGMLTYLAYSLMPLLFLIGLARLCHRDREKTMADLATRYNATLNESPPPLEKHLHSLVLIKKHFPRQPVFQYGEREFPAYGGPELDAEFLRIVEHVPNAKETMKRWRIKLIAERYAFGIGLIALMFIRVINRHQLQFLPYIMVPGLILLVISYLFSRSVRETMGALSWSYNLRIAPSELARREPANSPS